VAVPVAAIDVQAFVHVTEDMDKTMKAVINVFPPRYSDEISFTRTYLEGHHGNPIILIKTRIKKGVTALAFISNLASKLSGKSKEGLLANIERHVDEKENFYLRLDKQAAFLNRLELGSEDSIRIQIRLNLGQKSIENMVNLCRELGLIL